MGINIFISYAEESTEHYKKVLSLSNQLKMNNFNVFIYNDMGLGERIPVFMEKIENSDFVLFICTPKYKEKADKRDGGVGYEWNIITTNNANDRKFIPILFSGSWEKSLPIWARGKKGIDYRTSSNKELQKLISFLREYEKSKDAEILHFDELKFKISNYPKYTLNRDKMIIVNPDGKEDVCDVLMRIKIDDRKFLVYTKGEIERDLETIYSSEEVKIDNEMILVDIEDKYWKMIKGIMKKHIENHNG